MKNEIFMLMRLLWLTVLSTFLCTSGRAQSCIVRYITLTQTYQKDTFYFPIIRIHRSMDQDDYLRGDVLETHRKADTIITTARYQVTEPTCALICDGFGHEVVISPGDTVSVFCEKYPPGYTFTKDAIHPPWIFRFQYTGKSKSDFEIFDSLIYVDGLVHYDKLNFDQRRDSLEDFFNKSTIQYKSRVRFINDYESRNPLSPSAHNLVLSEVRYDYLTKLITPFIDPYYHVGAISRLPADYADSLKPPVGYDENLFKNTLYYSIYVYWSVNLFAGHFDKDSMSSGSQSLRLLDAYAGIDNEDVKNYLAATLMTQLITKGIPPGPEILSRFSAGFDDTGYRSYVAGLYEKESARPPITLAQALSAKVHTDTGTSTLKDLLGPKPVLLDCWASWCVPCIKQMRFSKQLESLYRDKVQFIYLSFDRSRKNWADVSEKLAIGPRNYLVTGNFKSDFAAYFNITSIPRYIIIGKDGKVVMTNAPMPSENAAIRKVLDEVISKN